MEIGWPCASAAVVAPRRVPEADSAFPRLGAVRRTRTAATVKTCDKSRRGNSQAGRGRRRRAGESMVPFRIRIARMSTAVRCVLRILPIFFLPAPRARRFQIEARLTGSPSFALDFEPPECRSLPSWRLLVRKPRYPTGLHAEEPLPTANPSSFPELSRH